MYVSPRPTDSLKSLPTRRFFFISGILGLFLSSLFPFLHNDCGNGKENEKKQTFYLPTSPVFEGWVGQGETYIFSNVA